MMLGCVVMASGEGKRFRAAGGRGSKLVADLAGMPLIARTVSSVPSGRYEVVMPTRGRMVRAVAELTPLPVRVVCHSSPLRSGSVRAGLSVGLGRWDGCLFLPGDQPLVSVRSFERLADAFAADPQRAYRLSWRGSPASPVLFPKSCFDALMCLQGNDGGGSVLRRGIVPVSLVEAESAHELLDVDVPTDLARAKELLRRSPEER